jgi:hypothetical protein
MKSTRFIRNQKELWNHESSEGEISRIVIGRIVFPGQL